MEAIELHLGLEVHKDSISMAIVESGPQRETRLLRPTTNNLHALETILARLHQAQPGHQ